MVTEQREEDWVSDMNKVVKDREEGKEVMTYLSQKKLPVLS